MANTLIRRGMAEYPAILDQWKAEGMNDTIVFNGHTFFAIQSSTSADPLFSGYSSKTSEASRVTQVKPVTHAEPTTTTVPAYTTPNISLAKKKYRVPVIESIPQPEAKPETDEVPNDVQSDLP